jgi:hypothetical protein
MGTMIDSGLLGALVAEAFYHFLSWRSWLLSSNLVPGTKLTAFQVLRMHI